MKTSLWVLEWHVPVGPRGSHLSSGLLAGLRHRSTWGRVTRALQVGHSVEAPQDSRRWRLRSLVQLWQTSQHSEICDPDLIYIVVRNVYTLRCSKLLICQTLSVLVPSCRSAKMPMETFSRGSTWRTWLFLTEQEHWLALGSRHRKLPGKKGLNLKHAPYLMNQHTLCQHVET